MTSLRRLALCVPLCLCGACATASGERAPLGAGHPASPAAPAVPIEDPSACLRARAVDVSPAALPEAAPGGAYVCPMHPGVSADEPGRCPECGMQLEPRAGQDAEESSHGH